MQRRNFLRNSLAATAAALAPATLLAKEENNAANINLGPNAGKPFQMDYAFHDGMFKNNGGADFIDQIKWAHDQGFRSIEDNGMLGRSVEQQQKIGDTLAKLGMTMGVFVIDGGDNWKTSLATGKKEFLDKFLDTCKKSIDVAKRCNAKWATVVPGYFERRLPIGVQTGHVVDALRRGAEILEPHGLVMVLEPLSDNPDLFLRTSDQTYAICRAVNSPSCKILFDMYHMQRNEGNIIQYMNLVWSEIAYFQIGDNPGRKEPTTGEMNYKNIFKHIYDKGYRGIMGMEHGNARPGKDGELALIAAYREVDSFKAGA
ncbi:hydroxypyruvate isomerase family protein [Paracnuella aquatica]|uniref:hydroxypyruvate isomerase family protein n=1 Tax=Paracnuella aquatica TaxID=2268757 RepID=UPI000DEF9F22|nr:TIM barrel protein [Paracnuella aquatica]RPD46079.1 xylose isomerase [Paracnuella aquatica]